MAGQVVHNNILKKKLVLPSFLPREVHALVLSPRCPPTPHPTSYAISYALPATLLPHTLLPSSLPPTPHIPGTNCAPLQVKGLLHRDPAKRLGANGAGEVKSHPFFAKLDFESVLAKQIPAPLRSSAEVDNPLDVSAHNER